MRKISTRKDDAGLVLAWKAMGSPARTLVREAYPSIHGHRKRVAGSIRVFSSNQSRVPGFAFSRRMSSGSGPGIREPRPAQPGIAGKRRRHAEAERALQDAPPLDRFFGAHSGQLKCLARNRKVPTPLMV